MDGHLHSQCSDTRTLSWQTIFRLVQKLLMDFLVLDPQGMCQCCVRKTSIDEQMHGEEKIREDPSSCFSSAEGKRCSIHEEARIMIIAPAGGVCHLRAA